MTLISELFVSLKIELASMKLIASTLVLFFFFQAEDGIRDVAVTGVQTCALPILCEATSNQYWRTSELTASKSSVFEETSRNPGRHQDDLSRSSIFSSRSSNRERDRKSVV